ncbi:MAG: F0F1 ATP synthase subunit A [Epsilonproteobacteria bacterium]|nr:F0F1 ATP synthase subunit A [Campylobacterota bacterium]
MEGLDLLNVPHWQPFKQFGYTHPFFSVNSVTVTSTWIVLLVLIVLVLCMRFFLTRRKSIIRFLTLSYINAFINLIEQALGTFYYNHFCFMTALFTFIAICNMISLLPGMEEPTQDINTTLSLGIIAFVYTQIVVIRRHGFIAYAREYFQPFFVMLPLNIVGHLASILSISFRLFGNIFGGATITHLVLAGIRGYSGPSVMGIVTLLCGSVMMVPISIIFGVFEGLIQAFVFFMLSLTHLGMSMQEASEPTERINGTNS